MRIKPNDSITLLISRENDKSSSLTFLDTNLNQCFKKVKQIIDPHDKGCENKSKINETKLLFREYNPDGYGKSLSYRFKGLSPEQVKKTIEKSLKYD